jgi:hypothetical protein
MAQLIFNIPDERMQELVDAWALGYQPTINGSPNPQTKQQYAKEQIRLVIASRVTKHQQAQQQPDFPVA